MTMNEFLNTIDKLGDDVVTNSIVIGTIGELHDDVLTELGICALSSCKELISVDLPNVTYLGETTSQADQFRGCSELKYVNLPKASKITRACFQYCEKMESINIESATVIGSSAFRGCEALSMIDLPKVTKIETQAFYVCEILGVVILRSATVCTLSKTSAFDATPFASGGTGGTVYVHAALITEYQNATNWSTLYAGGTCNFVAIEGSEYE